MPELPEVETVVRSIAPLITGERIRAAEFFSHRVTRNDFDVTAKSLFGATIVGVRRRGKQILIDLDRGLLYVHLGMTGRLLWKAEPGRYTRAIIELENGVLLYDDVRQFGRVEFFENATPSLSSVGPDALGIQFEDFHSRLRSRRGRLKAVILNQSFIAGVGNIYADESLFAARIHPLALSNRLSKQRVERLYKSMIEILQLAIHHRGSSISDYVDAAGKRGSFQQFHSVYGRAGEPCLRCGSPIRRVVVAGRGTHYCPRCQRV